MKMLAIGLYKSLSVASISRIITRQRGERAKEYPQVPDVLARLFRGVLVGCNSLFANRCITRKEEEDRRLATAIRTGTFTIRDHCPSCGLRHRQFEAMVEQGWCPSCGLRLRYSLGTLRHNLDMEITTDDRKNR